MEFYDFPYIGNVIIPTDFHIFQRGWNHQPVYLYIYKPDINQGREVEGQWVANAFLGCYQSFTNKNADRIKKTGGFAGRHRKSRAQMVKIYSNNIYIYIIIIIIMYIGNQTDEG